MIRSYICHGIQEIVSAPQDQDAYKIISDTCASVNCRLTIPAKSELDIHKITLGGSEFTYKGEDYKISLCGKFQISNAIFVLELLDRLAVRGYEISDKRIKESLKNTRISAKFEVLSIMPTIIADSTHSDVAISTVCESMSEFRDIIGSKIRLCLPDGAIVDKYMEVLSDQNYDIQKIVIAVNNSTEIPRDERFIYCKKKKELINRMLEGLEKDEILLISGPSAFTLDVRYELLARMGF
jgi:dihydrofolate synthase/folylpolyglutamate synthase